MNVPLVDLKIQYERIRGEVAEAWEDILSNTSFVLGPDVASFEDEFAAYAGVKHCVGVANGGDAIELALRALDIGFGDEVIIPANTYTATAMAVVQTGAVPVVVDVDPTYQLLSPGLVEAAITSKTKAIIPVHLFGQLAPMEPILEIARTHDLRVVEDAAQCQGATQHGSHAGTFGDIAATSFYPGKNLGAFGDGGGVLTNSDSLALRIRRLRNYGGIVKYEHVEPGRNSRLDTLQAAVLRAKLRYLDAWNAERSSAADFYLSELDGVLDLALPRQMAGNTHVWHLFVISTANRDGLLRELNARGIGAGIHYPQAIMDQPALAGIVRESSGGVARQLAGSILSLPLFPGITEAQQQAVVSVVRSFGS